MTLCLLRAAVCQTRSYVLAMGFKTSSVLFDTTNANPDNWRDDLDRSMRIFTDFVDKEEEESLMKEIEPYMRRLRYEYAHWDNAIHGYRETEKRQWTNENVKILDRIRGKAFSKNMQQIPSVHVLDLADDGWIKPHLDSVKFCGDIIAGLSLLTDSVMRMTLLGNEECCKDFLLPRRSLYIMSGAARYKFNHEILKNEESYYAGQHVPKTRRVSLICRCEPDQSTK